MSIWVLGCGTFSAGSLPLPASLEVISRFKKLEDTSNTVPTCAGNSYSKEKYALWEHSVRPPKIVSPMCQTVSGKGANQNWATNSTLPSRSFKRWISDEPY